MTLARRSPAGPRRSKLADDPWASLTPRLPLQRPFRHRRPQDHRRIRNGMLWMLGSGAPGRDLPEQDGTWHSVCVRFQRWTRLGLWPRPLHHLRRDAEPQGLLDGRRRPSLTVPSSALTPVHLVGGTVRHSAAPVVDSALSDTAEQQGTAGRSHSFCLAVGGTKRRTWKPCLTSVESSGSGTPARVLVPPCRSVTED
ncbi:transposase [Deinococcus sonorensis]|uniref:Transposase n=1 Tax=Deinococcus sonorensis TaxID=309891 RepID=A0ABV8Y483_9DEIO